MKNPGYTICFLCLLLLTSPVNGAFEAQRAHASDQIVAFEAKELERRNKTLDFLFEALKAAPDEAEAKQVEGQIWELMMIGPTPEITETLQRGMGQRRVFDFQGAVEILTGVIEQAPGYAEGWNQRAYAYFLQEKFDESLADLNRAIELEPRHYGALSGRFHVLQRMGRARLAQSSLRNAVDIYPFIQERSFLAE